jgi:hypothetical protein
VRSSPAFDWQHWPDGFRDVVRKYNLNVERISPVHGVGLEKGQPTPTRAQAEDLLKGGTQRARTLQGGGRERQLPFRVSGPEQILLTGGPMERGWGVRSSRFLVPAPSID